MSVRARARGPWLGPTLRGGFDVVVAIVVTAPLAWRLGDGLPLGREPVATVPLFNLWSLEWTARRLPHGLAGWWDAPIFWPARGAYANSELQPLTGAAFWLFRVATGPATAYGIVLIAALALDGWAMRRLARRLGAPIGIALACGALVQTLPFVLGELGVLQLVMLWPVLLTVERLLAWAEQPTSWAAVGIGLAFSASFLTCGYHALLLAVAAPLPACLLIRSSWRHEWRVRLGGALIAGAVPAGVCAWFLVGQQGRLDGLRWTAETIGSGSASWADLGPGGRRWAGWGLALLGGAGLVVGRRRREVQFLGGLVVIAGGLALGTRLSVFGWRPYRSLVEHVDALARLRSPFRAVAVAQWSLVALSAVSLSAAWQRRRAVGGVLVCGALVSSVWGRPLGSGSIVALPERQPGWSEWLSDHPGGPIAMLPMAPGRGVRDFELTTEWMVQALEHGHPLVNGYSGFFPEGNGELRAALNEFPDTAVIERLTGLGVRYVVADAAWWTSTRDREARANDVTVVSAGPDGVLLDLIG